MWRRSGGHVMRTLRRKSMISIFSFGMIQGTLPEPLKIDKNQAKSTVISRQGSRSLARLRDEMRAELCRLWGTQSILGTPSRWHTCFNRESSGMRTDEEMMEVEAMKHLHDDEINRLAKRGKLARGTFPVVGRVLPARAQLATKYRRV
ncbi:hypothetical protein Tco_0626755 [Tanacetum coccineum]|uniref:Uncharacterized protein n=1 Tax=Tanacetum coccineum TaxID=301880 RepID=A0ABQ4WKT1_9ASTR